jgi:hypothetical protein
MDTSPAISLAVAKAVPQALPQVISTHEAQLGRTRGILYTIRLDMRAGTVCHVG